MAAVVAVVVGRLAAAAPGYVVGGSWWQPPEEGCGWLVEGLGGRGEGGRWCRMDRELEEEGGGVGEWAPEATGSAG